MRWQRSSLLYTALILALTGCNIFSESKQIDYKSAGKLPALDVPPDLITPETDDRYAIPDTNASSTTFSSYNNENVAQPKAGSSVLLPTIQNVYIERAGTQRWLVLPHTPESVWPIIKEFWQELGFLIKHEIPEAGIMETDWAENRARIPQDFIRNFLSTFLDSIYSTAERDKFRTRLERDGAGNTEVYISHRGMDEILTKGSAQRTIWQPRPADPDLEAEMLSRLMIRFGVEEKRAKLELETVNNMIHERAYIDDRETGKTLIVNEAFDRAWRRVGLALDRIGFTVEDRDRTEGIYFVRYVDPEKDSYKTGDDDGLLSRFMFWLDKDDEDIKADKYLIQVDETDARSSIVTVLNEDHTTVKTSISIRILKLLHEQLK
ncbi:MAG: outer membrane protein assembly factor BamC [Nitrosomonas sp.]|nr:outer membrane protein assembly factor BamC [Nitrosomonas sp.]